MRKIRIPQAEAVSDETPGIPKSLATAFVATIIFGVAAMAIWIIFEMTKPPPAFEIPSCFYNRRGAPYEPGNQAAAAYFADKQNRPDVPVARLQTAIANCPVGACDDKHFKDYTWELSGYSAERMVIVQEADRAAGDNGVAYAQSLYAGADHVAIVEDLKARVRAKQVVFDGKMQNEDALRMLVYRPPHEFLPCRAKGQGSQWFYS